MTFEPSDPIDLVPTTTRVGNGVSARLIAVGVVALLVGVVGYAVINRPPAPPPVVAVATPAQAPPTPLPAPLPTPAPPRNELEGNDGIFGWAVVAQLPLTGGTVTVLPGRARTYSYAASMPITGGLLRVALERAVPEDYTGSVVIASADVGAALQIELGREWRQEGLTIFESFASWKLPLKALRRSHGGQVVLLVEHVPPRSTPSSASAVATGYTFTVIGRRDGSQLTLLLDLVWPDTAQFATYTGPRGPGLFNRCRWGDGPQGAPPRGNQDEAGCLDG